MSHQVTTAEALWAMKTSASDYSFASSDGTPRLIQKVFPGYVSDNFSMSRTKVSYLISDGLGPYLRRKLCHISHSGYGYTIQHDETGNSQGCKQCDILLRYWSDEKNEVSVRFLQTLFFGHAKGHDVGMKIVDTADSRVFKPEIQLSFFQIEVGEKTRTALYKLTTDQQKMALKGMKHFYLDN